MTGLMAGLAATQLIGMISPGPTALLVLKNGGALGRAQAWSTAAGITLATAVHVVASVVGLAEALRANELVARWVGWLGAAYLARLGLKILLAPRRAPQASGAVRSASLAGAHTTGFREGFVTNLLNPKVTLLYLALFGQLVGAGARPSELFAFGALVTAQSFGYWSLFAVVAGTEAFGRYWARYSGVAELCFGVLLLTFALRLVISI